VFNQEFIVDERYNVTKELGQGAYGIVWYDAPAAWCKRC
jgi:mitogen-activated protein kinase 7